MINFLGCSFTWGQGLYFEEWHKNNISSDKINSYINRQDFDHESLSYNDHLIRKEKHFTNFFSKHFDRDYTTQFFNGGSNYRILQYCDIVGGQFPTTDIVVVQFTSPLRMDEKDKTYIKNQPLDIISDAHNSFKDYNVYEKMISTLDKDDIITENVCKDLYTQIYLCNEKIDSYPNRINWIGISWFPEAGFIVKEFFKKHYIPIYYKDTEYLGFEDILPLDNLSLKNYIQGCGDDHFSSEGHIVLSNSIIKKIEQDNLFKDINIK